MWLWPITVIGLRRYGSLPELGFALVNSICNQFQCEQVGLGMAQGSVVREW